MKRIQTLNEMFELKIKALYDVENELIKALPKMAKAATDSDLKKALTDHLEETKEQAKRLEKIFRSLDLKPSKTKVEAIRGLVLDADWIVKQKPEKEALDSMIIAAAGYVEHYEMAGYTTASNWAGMLGLDEAEELLKETLAEEEASADKLELLAEEGIDQMALEAGVAFEKEED